MTTRILPREEYGRLSAIDPDLDWNSLPSRTKVLVVERNGEIVGRWMALPVVHVETVWKADGAGAGVTRCLLEGMKHILDEEGVEGAWTSATDDRVRGILANLHAVKVPGDHYFLRLTCHS